MTGLPSSSASVILFRRNSPVVDRTWVSVVSIGMGLVGSAQVQWFAYTQCNQIHLFCDHRPSHPSEGKTLHVEQEGAV